MDKAIEFFFSTLPPQWRYTVGILVLLIVAVPKLAELLRGFQDQRLGWRRLELEKLRLEILKLRVDLEQLAQQRQFPDIARELESVPPSPPPLATPPQALPERRSGVRGFVARYPRIGRPLMLTAQIICAFFSVAFAVDVVVMPWVGWNDPDLGPRISILYSFVFAALAWVSYMGFMAAGSIRQGAVATQ